jgi:hypothetical protein
MEGGQGMSITESKIPVKQQSNTGAHKTPENENSVLRFLFLSYTFTFVHNLF